MNSLFRGIPMEIVNIILSYDGSIKERNGKYMKQISKTDERYQLLERISRPHLICASYYGSYAYVHILDGTCRLTKTEYYDVIVYILYKNARPIADSRYICF